MAIEYTSHDKALRDSIQFMLRADTEFVDMGATMSELGNYLGSPWPFQFPPRITADSKAAEWNEVRRVSYEPVAMWMGADARVLSLEATYVVTGEKEFSGIEIARMANAAKAYFYRSIEAAYAEKGFGPIVEIDSLYGAVRENSTWRMTSVEVTYSDTFVNDATEGRNNNKPPVKTSTQMDAEAQIKAGGLNSKDLANQQAAAAGGPQPPSMWPLWTKITFNLKSWTRNAAEPGKEKQAVQALVPSPTAKWF